MLSGNGASSSESEEGDAKSRGRAPGRFRDRAAAQKAPAITADKGEIAGKKTEMVCKTINKGEARKEKEERAAKAEAAKEKAAKAKEEDDL